MVINRSGAPNSARSGALQRHPNQRGAPQAQKENFMTKAIKAVLLVVALSYSGLALTACNTMEGLGEDVERGGEKLQGAADSTKKKM
jgi:entericidin B